MYACLPPATGAVRRLFACLIVCFLAGCGSGLQSPAPSTPAAAVASKWVGAWGDAPSNASKSPDDPGGSEQSFRFLVNPTIGATQERVRFSNYFGTTPVTIGAGRLAIGKDGSPTIDANHDVPLTFNGGSPSVTMAPGQIVVSDAVDLTYSFGQTLAVSVYVSGTFPPLTRHDALFNQNYRTAIGAGDQTADSAGTAFTAADSDWLLLNGIDAYGPYQGTVVIFGSSTTDGFHSNYGNTSVYPVPNVAVTGQHRSRITDWLAKQLNASGYSIGVLNEGIPADTIAPDSTNATNHLQPGVERFSRDALAQPNVIAIVNYLGAIDLRDADCGSATAVEAATQTVVAAAAAAKVPIFLATLPPSAFCTNPARANYGPSPTASDPYAGAGTVNGGEVQRRAFNTWIRSTGVGLPGVAGLVDLDQVLADTTRPNFLLPAYNSGDNYHPNGAGYGAAAGAIPIEAIKSMAARR